MGKTFCAWALGAVVCAHALAPNALSAEMQTNQFGFLGKEIFPVDPQIGQMRVADINGDNLLDLAVINNGRAKINLLINQTGQTNALMSPTGRVQINELPPDARFRIDSIASEKRISSFVVTDLNNDKRPDIAYYGEPKELVLQYNLGTNGWSALKRFAINDGTLDPYALTTGDLNGDSRTDLLLLAEEHIYFLAQAKDGSLVEPEKIPYVGLVKSMQAMDLQGDGREDLMLIKWDNPNPFRVRLQNEVGQLGPEMHFTLPPIRSYWADDLDGDKKTEIVTIAQKSGRAQLLLFSKQKGEQLLENWVQGQFQALPLSRTRKARRGIVWGDLNKDQRVDLLVAEPDSGQLTAFLQNDKGALDAPRTFSTLTGVSDLAVADWDGDGQSEIFLLSADERQIGVTSLDDKKKIAFPKNIPFEGRPLVLAVGKVEKDGPVSLAVILDLDGKRELRLRGSDGSVKRHKLSEAFKGNPSSLTLHDVNQDGLEDFVVLVPYEKIKMLVQHPGGEFEEVDLAPPGGSAEQPWLSLADVDADGKAELLLAQKNFVRAVVLHADGPATTSNEKEPAAKTEAPTEAKEPEKAPSFTRSSWSFHVREQINGASSSSRITGAAAIPRGGKGAALALLDAERKALSICERDQAGAWKLIKNIPLPVTEFNGLDAIALGQSEPNTVAFLGLNTVGWLSLGGESWQLTEADGYETPIKDGYLHDLISGDLNADNQKDLIFLETGKSYIDIVTFAKPHKLVPANRWQVFEERTFRSRRNDMAEPREALVADFTGDNKNDLIVLVHDRVILYPQE